MKNTFVLAKDYGFEFASNLDFISRPGIYWEWKRPPFNGTVFGSSLDAAHCFIDAGLHDFAHCLDFMMRGKGNRVTDTGLSVKRKWLKWIPVFGLYDGSPKTAQATESEVRAFALQAYLQQRETGHITCDLDYDEEHECREQGLLDHLPQPPNDPCALFPRLEYRVLKQVSIEGFAHDKRSLVSYPWADSRLFLESRGYGHGDEKRSSRESDKLWQDCFEQAIIEEFERLTADPTLESKLSETIDRLAARIRRYQRQNGFVPMEQHIGPRPLTRHRKAA